MLLTKAALAADDHVVLLMLICRHGLRVSEAIGMRRDQLDIKHSHFGWAASRVRRAPNSGRRAARHQALFC
jgi:integrase